MRCPAAKAPISDSSPAITDAHIILANLCAFAPGSTWFAPFTPSSSSIALCGDRTVPPPTVPTSIDGIEQLISKSLSSLML